MKFKSTYFVFLLSLFIYNAGEAQLSLSYDVFPDQEEHVISPYIYGVNGQDRPGSTASRAGGNRFTGYNWETNFSNAGSDYIHHSDYYLPWIVGLPENLWDIPGIVLTDFIDKCNANDQYSLVTLPMAGYVAADADGTVEENQAAPSARWNRVENVTPDGMIPMPDLNDGVVYVDQEMQLLIQKYGISNADNGVKAYALDNEPALWPYTHSRLHSEFTGVGELIDRSVDLATTIKSVDASAHVYGPALYGFYAMYNLQDAPDWASYSDEYDTFIDAYLDNMKSAADEEGRRLLDVLDVHWYPEPEGVYGGNTDQTTSIRRMNAPRSLWDDSYTEESWIADFIGEPIMMINRWQASIDSYYPGTRIGITEYDYGAVDHISGGVAQVEAFAAFAMKNVYFASKWGSTDGYVGGAYDLFVNYDYDGSSFGNRLINTQVSDQDLSTFISAVDETTDDIHMIITNRSWDESISASVSISGSENYDSLHIYRLSSIDTLVEKVTTILITDNQLTLDLVPASAYHLVAEKAELSSAENNHISRFTIYPNPAHETLHLNYDEQLNKVVIVDAAGQVLNEQVYKASSSSSVDIRELSIGTYFIEAYFDNGDRVSQKFIKK